MQQYIYTRLKNEREIRLFQLFPGEFDDEIRGRLHTVELVPPDDTPWRFEEHGAEELQKTLPSGWRVRETLSGRYLFVQKSVNKGNGPRVTSWAHPTTCAVPRPRYSDHSSPPYEGLSYVWGDADRGCSIKLEQDNSGTVMTLDIRNSLMVALRHLRYTHCDRLLWIDGVSIDQSNLLERSAQVRRMGRIFGLAKRVIVWLGPEADESSLAMATLGRLGRQCESYEDGVFWINAPDCEHPDWFHPAVALPYDGTTWQAVAALVQRPWFKRVWTLQEAIFGSNSSMVQCGNVEVSLRSFVEGLMCASEKQSTTSLTPDLKAMLRSAGYSCRRYRTWPYISMLLDLRGQECSDPRDKVYGTLGLAPPSIARLIIPDYHKSASEVYKDTCLALLQATGRLDFLVACLLCTERTSELPTWALDFSTVLDRGHGEFWNLYDARGPSRAAVRLLDGTNRLEVMGVLCGAIREASQEALPDTSVVAATVQDWRGMCPAGDTYVAGGSMINAFAESISRHRQSDQGSQKLHVRSVKVCSANFVMCTLGGDLSSC